jgi:hypothetical protein
MNWAREPIACKGTRTAAGPDDVPATVLSPVGDERGTIAGYRTPVVSVRDDKCQTLDPTRAEAGMTGVERIRRYRQRLR